MFNSEMWRSAGLSIPLVFMSACVAWAVDTQPLDFIPLPPGSNGALLYLNYGHNDGVVIDGEETTGSLETFAITPRYVYFFDVGGYTADVNILLPYVSLNDGDLSGFKLDSASGVGDLSIVGTFWFLNDSDERKHAAIAAYLNVPTGEYEPGDALNTGSNRVSGSLQLGGTFGLSDRWTLDAVTDVTVYGDNNNSDGLGGKLSQDPTYTAQTWLTYHVNDRFNLSAGYGIYGGGKQFVNGDYNGFNSKKQQIRLSSSYFVTPTVQIMGQINHDFDVDGGFEQDYSALVRIFKMF